MWMFICMCVCNAHVYFGRKCIASPPGPPPPPLPQRGKHKSSQEIYMSYQVRRKEDKTRSCLVYIYSQLRASPSSSFKISKLRRKVTLTISLHTIFKNKNLLKIIITTIKSKLSLPILLFMLCLNWISIFCFHFILTRLYFLLVPENLSHVKYK